MYFVPTVGMDLALTDRRVQITVPAMHTEQCIGNIEPALKNKTAFAGMLIHKPGKRSY